MDTVLLVNVSGQTYNSLDLYQEIPISITFQQSDLTNLNQRRVPYSKTITLPSTSQNSIVFEQYYEVNGIDFNPLNKLPCVVQYRGTDIFRGYLRLNAVVQRGSFREYEVYILGDVADWATQVKDLTLQQLDWTEYTHEQTYSAVTKSWEATALTNDGLFNGDILYPLANYGLVYPSDGTGATPTFTYGFSTPNGFDTTANPVTVDTFKPAIRIKRIVEKIFDKTDYQLLSDFFDTEYFRSIYMDTFQNDRIGILPASGVTNQNIFQVYSDGPFVYFMPAAVGSVPYQRLNFSTLGSDGYDPLGNFTLGNPTVQFDPPIIPNNQSYFQAPYNGDYFWNFRCDYDGSRNIQDQFINFRIAARKGTDLNTLSAQTPFYQSQLYNVNEFTPRTNIDLYFSGNCTIGEYVALYIDFKSGNGGASVTLYNFVSPGLTEPEIMWELYNSPTLAGTQIADLSLGIDNMNSFEFIRALITMFNLVIIQDEQEKTIRIEPYSWYYNDADRPKQDWTERVDLSQEYRIEPLSFDLSKQVVWTNTDTQNEYLNKLWTDRYDFVYGRYKFISNNNIFSGEQEYVLPFGSVPTEGITNAPNFIIPKFYYLNNGLQAPYATKPHLFFWTGNRYAYKDVNKTQPGYWYLASGATPVQQTTYPCVSHLSSLDIRIPSLVSDLNFESQFDFFGNNNNQILQFTPYNLFGLWWSDYIQNIYSPETRRLTCRVFFNPVYVYETSLRDQVFIKDSWYTIEKINEADLVNRKLTEVSLIKDRIPYYKLIPPAPNYTLEPQTPYPGVEPAFTTLCYVSFDKTDVCSGAAPLLNILTFGTGTFSAFDEVYYDSGTAMVKLPQGNYLRQTTSSDVWLVIDNYGRILQNNC